MTDLNKNLKNHEMMELCMEFVLVCHDAKPLEEFVESLNFKPDNPGQFAYIAFQAITTAPENALGMVGKTCEEMLELMNEKEIYFDEGTTFVKDLASCEDNRERHREFNAYMNACTTAAQAFELGAVLGATSVVAGVKDLEGMGIDLLSYLPHFPESDEAEEQRVKNKFLGLH